MSIATIAAIFNDAALTHDTKMGMIGMIPTAAVTPAVTPEKTHVIPDIVIEGSSPSKKRKADETPASPAKKQKKEDRKKTQCGECKAFGHNKRKCPTLLAKVVVSDSESGSESESEPEKKVTKKKECQYCGKKTNHPKTKCPAYIQAKQWIAEDKDSDEESEESEQSDDESESSDEESESESESEEAPEEEAPKKNKCGVCCKEGHNRQRCPIILNAIARGEM